MKIYSGGYKFLGRNFDLAFTNKKKYILPYIKRSSLYYIHLIDANFHLGGSFKYLNITNKSLITHVSNLIHLLNLNLTCFDLIKVNRFVEGASFLRGNFRFVHIMKNVNLNISTLSKTNLELNRYNLDFHFKWVPGTLSNFRFVSKDFYKFKIPHFGFIGNNDKNKVVSNEFVSFRAPFTSCVDSITYDIFKLSFPIIGNGSSLPSVLFYFSYFFNSILTGKLSEAMSFRFSKKKKYFNKNIFFKRYLIFKFAHA